MRVNMYAEEMTDRIEIIGKEIDGTVFTGLRFYLDLPCTLPRDVYLSGPTPSVRPMHVESAGDKFSEGNRHVRSWLVSRLLLRPGLR